MDDQERYYEAKLTYEIDPSDLTAALDRYHPGDKVSVSWANQLGQTRTATVTLASGPTG